jgi:hypothetical protein
VDIESCQFTRGDPSKDHLAGTPIVYRMSGDAIAEAETEEILQALLAHHLATEAAKPHVRADMPDMKSHLERFRGLLGRIASLPISLEQDKSVPLLLVCVPRMYAGQRDYLAGSDSLPLPDRLAVYERQQDALQRVSGDGFMIDLTTNYGQPIKLPGQLKRRVTAER